jgi:alkaline phosphatase D
MAIDFKTFNTVVDFVLDDKKPVLIRGRHGIGKSCVVYQTGERRGLPVVERRASQMTEGDLMGLPSVDGNSTKWNAPDWFKSACDKAVLLFLDEVDRATLEVRQGIFELTDSRKLNGWHLHPDTIILAAVNGGEHGANYSVGEMDPAELDRWTCFDIEPTVEDWLTWGKDNVCTLVWDFINQNRNHLEHNDDPEPNKVYPSRRSWHRFSDCLITGKLAEGKKSLDIVFHLATGYVGFEAAVAFKDFAENYESIVTPEDVLRDGIEKVKDLDINKFNALNEKFEVVLKDKELTEDEVTNLASYFGILPAELAVHFWGKVCASNPSVLDKLHTEVINGKPFGLFIADLVA